MKKQPLKMPFWETAVRLHAFQSAEDPRCERVPISYLLVYRDLDPDRSSSEDIA